MGEQKDNKHSLGGFCEIHLILHRPAQLWKTTYRYFTTLKTYGFSCSLTGWSPLPEKVWSQKICQKLIQLTKVKRFATGTPWGVMGSLGSLGSEPGGGELAPQCHELGFLVDHGYNVAFILFLVARDYTTIYTFKTLEIPTVITNMKRIIQYLSPETS